MSLLIALSLVMASSGCSDRVYLEDITLALMYGLDLDENNNLMVYMSSPVFSKEAQKKEEVHEFVTKSIHFSSKQFDSVVTALTSGGKLQTLLISRKIMEHPDWFPLLDLLYRDPKLSVNCIVAVVDGSMKEIFFHNAEDKPRLMRHVKKLIVTSDLRNITVITTMLELHRQMYEKGETPALTLIKKNKEIEIAGTALLDEQGQYKTALSFQETTLLSVLKHKKSRLTLSEKLPLMEKKSFYDSNLISILLHKPRYKIKTTFEAGQFNFEIRINTAIIIAERMFSMDTSQKAEQLEAMIEERLNKRYADLMSKVQKNKIDPIGLGLYARAYQYKEWKNVQDHWGEALSRAKITVKINVEIVDSGNIQ